MKKFAYISFIIFSISLIFTSCNSTYNSATESTTVAKDPASDLWSRITGENYASTWKHWLGKEPFYKGTHPHGAILSTYLNSTAYNALTAGAKELPYGSIIVKENYSPDGKMLGAVTVMERVEGFNPEDGDWYWAKYKADGSLHTMPMDDGSEMKLAGKVGGCIGCHTASAGGIKYIMTPVKK